MSSATLPTARRLATHSAGIRPAWRVRPATAVVGALLVLGLSNRAATPPGAPGFVEDFEGRAGLAARGWEVKSTPEQSEWSIRNGCLQMVGHYNPYKGGSITRKVPFFERGTFEFDAKFATSGRRDYRHFSLGFRLYGHMTAFKNYGTHAWLQYRPHKKTWATLATGVPLAEWVHIKVVFDFPDRRAEYYCGTGADPVFVDPDLDVDLTRAGHELVFFNYGLCNGTVTNLIDNIRLTGVSESGAAAPPVRDGLVLFEGVSASRYAVRQILRAEFAADKVSAYPVVTRGAAIAPRNILRLRRVPGRRRWQQASLIVLADAPAVPNACLPGYLLEDLVAAVKQGAHLLVLGGMFSLGKGGYQDTPLAALVPVGPLAPWNGRRFDKPMPLREPGTGRKASEADRGTVLWFHDCPRIAAGAEVLLEAGGRPMAVRTRYGRGAVTVFLGMACGDFSTTDSIPFWKSPQWPQTLKQLTARRRAK